MATTRNLRQRRWTACNPSKQSSSQRPLVQGAWLPSHRFVVLFLLAMVFVNGVSITHAFSLQESSLQDLVESNSKHLAFVGSFQRHFEGASQCTDACIFTAHSGFGTDCAQLEAFFPTQISLSPSIWVWESSDIPSGEYNAMLATDELCWEAVGEETDLGVMEPVKFSIPSLGSTVRLTYHEDVNRVTAQVMPLADRFNCDGKPAFFPSFDDYGPPFQDDETEFPEYGRYFTGEHARGAEQPNARACDFPHMLAADYNISIIETKNIPNLESLVGAGVSDPYVRFTLPDTDPFGSWETEPMSDCSNCTFPWTMAGRMVEMGIKVGGSRLDVELLDHDIGFEWTDDLVGTVSTTLMHCSFSDVRSDAVCSTFLTETDCKSWQPAQYNQNEEVWDDNTCQWINGLCRGCEAYDTETSCYNANCHWKNDQCGDVCSQDAWLSVGNGTCATYNSTLDEWTFDPDVPCVRIRQEAAPFLANIESVLFNDGGMRVASSGEFSRDEVPDSECTYTDDEQVELDSLDCDTMLEVLDFDVVRQAHPLCIPCQNSLEFQWKIRQGYTYVGDTSSKVNDLGSAEYFRLPGGSLLITQPQSYFTSDQGSYIYARKVTASKWMSFRTNMDVRVWFFRSAGTEYPILRDTTRGDMLMIPEWLEDGITDDNGNAVLESGEAVPLGLDGGYTFTSVAAMSLQDEIVDSSQYYGAWYRDFSAGDTVFLGGSAQGVGAAEYYEQLCVENNETCLSNPEYPLKMYSVMLSPLVEVTDYSTCDVTIDTLPFVITTVTYVIPLIGFTLMVWWFLDNKLDYNFDMIPSYVARQVLTGPNHNILGSIPASYKSGLRGDRDDVWFRRNLHYATKAIQLVCWAPLALWSSFGASLIGTTNPPAFGICVLFLGNAFLLGGCATLAWRRRQWRMTVGIRYLYMGAIAMVVGFLLAVSIYDPCGVSFFSITTAFLTINMLVMGRVNFVACPHVADAFAEIDRHSASHDEVMAEIMASLGEDGDNAGSPKGAGKGNSGLTSYISECYSINPRYPLFKFSNAFVRNAKSHLNTSRGAGAVSTVVLVVYCVVVRFLIPDEDITALGVALTVFLLDAAVYMLRNGSMTWSPAYITILQLLSRVFLVGFNSELWILGHAFAYFVFGIAVCREVIDQKLPRVTGLDAGAVAYFGRGSNVHEEQKRRQHRQRNVAGSPVFVAGYLFVVLALIVVLSILTYGDDVPAVDLIGNEVPATSIAVALVVICIFIFLMLASTRAMYLERNSLLKTKSYFCVKKISIASLLGMIFVAYTILTGVMLTALTGSAVWIQICVFVPLIMVSGGYSISQYFRNDCSFSLTPTQRAKDIALFKMMQEDDEDDEEENAADGDHPKDANPSSILSPLFSPTNSKRPNQMPSLPIKMPEKLAEKAKLLKADGDLKTAGSAADVRAASTADSEVEKKVVLPPLKRDEDEEGYDPDEYQSCIKLFQLFWDGKLAPREYHTGFALFCCVTLSLLFGLCLTYFVRPWYLGTMTVLLGATAVLGLLPLYQYARTWQFNAGMVLCLIGSYLCLNGFSAIMFLVVFDGSVAVAGNIILASVLFWWPELLFVGFTLVFWSQQNFKVSRMVNGSLIWFAICLFLFGGVIFFWAQNFYLFAAYLLVVFLLAYGYVILQMWLSNDRYLPPSAITASAIVVFVIVAGSLIAAALFNADLFFCLSVCFLTVSAALVARFFGAAGLQSKETPVGYNASLFPVYMYDPMHADVFDESSSAWGILQMFFVLLLWGASCTIYFVPVDVGVGLVAVVVVSLQIAFSHLSTKTVLELGKSLRCVDHLILKTAAMRADEKYQTRRTPFTLITPKDVEETELTQAQKLQALNMYAKQKPNDAANKAHGLEGLEKNSDKMSVAQIRTMHLDHMHLRSAKHYAKKILMLQNNLRYLDSRGVLVEHDAAMVGDLEHMDHETANSSDASDIAAFSTLAVYVVCFVGFAIYFVAGYFYDMSTVEYDVQLVYAIVLVVWGMAFAGLLGRRQRRRKHRVDGVYDDAAAMRDVVQTGSGPLGWLCCFGCFYKGQVVAKQAIEAQKGRYSRVKATDATPLDALPETLRRFRGKKVKEEQRTQSKSAVKDRGEHGAADLVETLRSLPGLHRCLDYQYREEMRAFAHFCLLVIQAADEHLAREGIRFQQFLREYRFKLLANNITPPRRIFTSKSYATIDVNLVASWLSGLTVEQKKRFDQLKATFTQDITHQLSNQIDEDEEEQEQAEELAQERAHREYDMNCKRYERFIKRRELREKENRPLPDDADEMLADVHEQLEEIAKGDRAQPGKFGRTFQFVDPEFPHNTSSIGDCQGQQHVVGWSEASEINATAALFRDGSDPDDVFQGELYNQWLLSALSMVAASGGVDDGEVDALIDNLFINKDTTTGAYAIKLWVNSQWESVLVDDFFPVRDDKFKASRCAGVAFAHSHNMSELWVPLFEKAVSKYYGSYAVLERGFVQHALTLITGAPTQCLYLADASNGSGKALLWRNLLKAHENKYILGAASITGDTTHKEILESGIMMNAAYLIYDVVQVDQYQLIKLRNPPDYGEGSPEWQGDWSDKSPLWTKKMRKKLGMVEDEADNQFWMSFDDFCIVFRCVYLCKAINDDHWKKLKVPGSWTLADNTAVGLPGPLNPECDLTKLPQYSIFVHRPTDVLIHLSQTQNGYATLQDPPYRVAVYLCRSQKGGAIGKDGAFPIHCKPHQAKVVDRITNVGLVAHSGEPKPVHEVSIEARLLPGYYSVVCALYQRGLEGPFELQVTSRHPVVLERIDPLLKTWKEKRLEELKDTRKKLDTELDKISHITGEKQMDFVSYDHNKSPNEVPFNWVKLKDEGTQKEYFFNTATKQSLWEPPADWDEGKGAKRKAEWEKEKAERKAARKAAKAKARKEQQQQNLPQE